MNNLGNHVRILGIISLIFGGMGALVLLALALLTVTGFTMLGIGTGEEAPFWLAGSFGALYVVIAMFATLPSILVGYGLLKKRQWGRILGIVVSIVNLFGFPVGTALGIYGLIVLCHGETTLIFSPPPLRPTPPQ